MYFIGVILAQLVLKSISLLHNIGISIEGIVCDGASTNKKMWSELGIVGTQNETKHYFEHPLIPHKWKEFMPSQILYICLSVYGIASIIINI